MSEDLPFKRKYGVPEYRDTVVRRLETAYGDNKLELEEYERRLELAYRAEFMEDLELLVRDFPVRQEPSGHSPARRDRADEVYSVEEEGSTRITFLGDKHLTTEDFFAHKLRTISILGDINIDVRGSRESREPLRIEVFSVIGDTRIIIPRGMKVKNKLKNLLGDYELLRNAEESTPEQDPTEANGTCILEGFSLLGDISIQEEGSRKKGFLQKFFKGRGNRE